MPITPTHLTTSFGATSASNYGRFLCLLCSAVLLVGLIPLTSWGQHTVSTPTLYSPSNGANNIGTTLQLDWSRTNGASQYHVKVSTSSDFLSGFIVNTREPHASSYTITSGLDRSTTYYWKVQGYYTTSGCPGQRNDTCEDPSPEIIDGPWSSVRSFTTAPSAPPKPTGLSPSGDDVSLSPTLTWDPVAGPVDRYLVRWGVSGSSSWINTVSATGTQYSISGLTESASYDWQVRAENDGGSTWSDIETFTTTLPAPDTPTLSAPADNASNVELTPYLNWNAASGADGYEVRVSGPGSAITPETADSGTGLTWPHALQRGQTYTWEVRAYSEVLEQVCDGPDGRPDCSLQVVDRADGSWSASRSFTTIPPKPPKPTGLSPSGAGALQSPTLTWDAVTGPVDHYRIEWKRDGQNWSDATSRNMTATSTDIGPLLSRTKYIWRVRAENPGGESDFSEATFTTQNPDPPSLIAPAAEATGVDTKPTFSWTAIAGATGYEVSYGTSTSASGTRVKFDFATSGTIDARLAQKTIYYWKVRSYIKETTRTCPNPQEVWCPDPIVSVNYYYGDWSSIRWFESGGSYARSPIVDVLSSTSSETYRAPYLNSTQAETATTRQKSRSATFVNGLGKPTLSVAAHASPDGMDVVTPIEYDDLGRQTTNYLPYVSDYTNGRYVDNATAAQGAFYNDPSRLTGFPTTQHPYSETTLEASPLERAREKGNFGEAWKMDGGRTVKTEYGTNAPGDVRRLSVSASGDVSEAGYYAQGVLAKQTLTDPNGERTVVYTDRDGREVMKVDFEDGTTQVVTRYLYDRLGQLRWILPPKAYQEWTSGSSTLQAALEKWGTRYEYDGEGRQTEKHAAEGKVETTVYDRLGRPFLRQNNRHRKNGEWVFTKYDRQGRAVITGIYTEPTQGRDTLRSEMQAFVDGLSPTHLFEQPAESGNSDALHGYTNRTFPSEGLYVWTVTDYDDYDFNGDGTADAQFEPGDFPATDRTVSTPEGSLSIQGHEAFDRVVGKTTRSRVRVLDPQSVYGGGTYSSGPSPVPDAVYYEGEVRLTSGFRSNPGQELRIGPNVSAPPDADEPRWIVTIPFYNRNGTTIQVQREGIVSRDVTSTQYTFDGKTRATLQKHSRRDSNAVANGQVEFVVRRTFDYDDAGRTTRVYQKNGTTPEIIVAAYTYNALGQRIREDLHSTDGGASFAQSVTMERNVRGWMTQKTTRAGSTVLFDMELGYNDVLDTSTPRYDGTISWIRQRLPSAHHKRFGHLYTYDGLGRLTNAAYRKWQDESVGGGIIANESGRYSLAATYDLNGNIQTLKRWGLYQEYVQKTTCSGGTFGSKETSSTDESVGTNGLAGPIQDGPDGPGGPGGCTTYFVQEDVDGIIDDLEYTYGGPGNQLTNVTDASGVGEGFLQSGSIQSSDVGYTYDGDGNLVEDRHKGLTTRYAGMDLPERVQWKDGRRIEWLWTATGEKLRRTVYGTGGLTETKEYTAGFTYRYDHTETRTLDFLAMPSGRVAYDATSDALRYQYAHTDQIGTTRVLYEPAQGTQTSGTVRQHLSTYPYGLSLGKEYTDDASTNETLFHGKELTDDHSLNWYHYGARFYDVARAQWTTMDPADEFHSPYSYVGGNPVNLTDPDGRSSSRVLDDWYISNDGEVYVHRTNDPFDTFNVQNSLGEYVRVALFFKNSVGLIPILPQFQTSTHLLPDLGSFGWGRVYRTREERYASGRALAAILGALHETSTSDLAMGRFSGPRGGSPGKSTSHVDGRNADVRALRVDYTGEPVTTNSSMFDYPRNTMFVLALRKYGYSFVGSSPGTYGNTVSVYDTPGEAETEMVPGAGYLPDHHDHFHLQGLRSATELPLIQSPPKH